jgi:hypothetical protein
VDPPIVPPVETPVGGVGKFRYDAFVISPYLDISKVQGVEFTSTPVYPDIPAGSLLIGYLLVRKGQMVITDADIAAWKALVPSQIVIETVDQGGQWSITASVLDQYGYACTRANGWDLQIAISYGDGSVSPSTGNTGSGNYFTFIYTEGTAGSVVSLEVSLNQNGYMAHGMKALQL